MSLLRRIAISQGDQARQAAANAAIATMDQHRVVNWNRHLQTEICRKTRQAFSRRSYVRETTQH